MRGWLPIFRFVLIANNISTRDASDNSVLLYDAPLNRFPSEDKKAISGVDDSFFDEDNSIAWQYYDENAQSRKVFSDHLRIKKRTAYHELAVKNGQGQKLPMIGEIPLKCQDLPPIKAQQCLYRITKLSGGQSGSGPWGHGTSNFAMAYYDDYWRTAANMDDFDDFDDDDTELDNTFSSQLNPDDNVKRGSETTKSNEDTKIDVALRSPGDYGHYDYEEDKTPSSISQKDIDSLKRVYYDITGDKYVNKGKIVKFLKDLNEKIRVYSMNIHDKAIPEEK